MSTCSSRSMSNITSIKPFFAFTKQCHFKLFQYFFLWDFFFFFCFILWLKPLNKYIVCAEHCYGSYMITFKTLYTLGKSIIFILKIRKTKLRRKSNLPKAKSLMSFRVRNQTKPVLFPHYLMPWLWSLLYFFITSNVPQTPWRYELCLIYLSASCIIFIKNCTDWVLFNQIVPNAPWKRGVKGVGGFSIPLDWAFAHTDQKRAWVSQSSSVHLGLHFLAF